MAEGTSNSIVNFGEISKPADTLIKKVSKAVGGFFEPYQVTRMAKAEAEAAMIKAQSEIQITDLHRRAMHRFIEEEAQRQKNIEDITAKALRELKEGAKPDDMKDDWVTNFFDKSRIVSDEQMQSLWARVLAGEANAPGSFSKRTVNSLADIDKGDAEIFRKLCGFGWKITDFVPVVLDYNEPIYSQCFDFEALTHLDSIGLIHFQPLSGFRQTKLPKSFSAHYFGESFTLEFENEHDNSLIIGSTFLTKVGQELATVCEPTKVPGFFEYAKSKWDIYKVDGVFLSNP